MTPPKFDFSELSADERIQLAEDLWDSLADLAEGMPIPAAHSEEIDRRRAAYLQDHDRGVPWRVVLDEIDARLTQKRGA